MKQVLALPGARPSHGERASSRRATRALSFKFWLFFAGDACLLGACSGFSDPLPAAVALAEQTWAQQTQTLALRGHEQRLHLYGPPSGEPVIVTSGDGGWVHLAPHIASVLADHGFHVVGFDAKAYLTSFTSGRTALDPTLEPDDYATLAERAAAATSKKPVLIGVSEGAGLSLLAATNARIKQMIGGVLAVGLPDVNELGWRWQDSVIYLTHKVPNEPTFSTSAVAANVTPVPLAAIHSTNDEFVPLEVVQRIMRNANEPKRLWIVNASDHRFSNGTQEFDARLLGALDWIKQHAPK
jgi:predicted alpha/beta hydrolase family esterase